MNGRYRYLIIMVFALIMFAGARYLIGSPDEIDESKVSDPHGTAGNSVAENDNDGTSQKAQLLLGYCPTMRPEAENLMSMNEDIVLQSYGSTAQAFQGLSAGDVDMVLVGRLAAREERRDYEEVKLGEGYTLIGGSKGWIQAASIGAQEIHTSADPEVALNYLGNIEKVIFHETTELSLAHGRDSLILIDWQEFEDGMELVIPVDEWMNKEKMFRIPVLYCGMKDTCGKVNR